MCQLANYLRSKKVGKGYNVTIYMPMIPELPIAMVCVCEGGEGLQCACVWWGGGAICMPMISDLPNAMGCVVGGASVSVCGWLGSGGIFNVIVC